MSQWINWGDGSDGSPNAISGTVNTYATCTGTAGQTVLTTALSASDGDQILIHQTQHATAAGTWEIVKVSSDAGTTLNLYSALVNSYSTGAQCVLIPQYTGGTISGAVTGTAWNGSIGGIIALMSNGDLTVSGSITAPAGFTGGTGNAGAGGNQGNGTVGNGGASTSANGNGGGGGYSGAGGARGGGGAGGANGANGSTGADWTGGGGGTATGGSASGIAALTTSTFGGGGGAGGNDDGRSGAGAGGNGGGLIFIFSKNFTLSGTLLANATAGATDSDNYCGTGGGGAGGSVLIKTQVGILGTNLITVAAGAGGTTSRGTECGGFGGAGSVGRIRCDYFTSVSGSTTPTLSSAQDPTLNVAGGSGFFNFF